MKLFHLLIAVLLASASLSQAISVIIDNKKQDTIIVTATNEQGSNFGPITVAASTTGSLPLQEAGNYSFSIDENGSEFATSFQVEDKDTILLRGDAGSISVRLDRPRK